MWHTVLKIILSVIFYPIALVRTLIQLGYEPLQPVPIKTILGTEVLQLANVFEYLWHIYKRDGVSGCYQGVILHVLTRVICDTIFYCNTLLIDKILQVWIYEVEDEYFEATWNSDDEGTSSDVSDSSTSDSDKENQEETSSSDSEKDILHDQRTDAEAMTSDEVPFTQFRQTVAYPHVRLVLETFSRTIAVVISHPMQVLSIRCLVQLVNKDKGRTSSHVTMGELLKAEGLRVVFLGLAPRLIREMLMEAIRCVTHDLLTRVFVCDPLIELCIMKLLEMMADVFCYKFTVLSTVMIAKGGSWAASDVPYQYFTTAWSHLKKLGELNRGRSLLFRYKEVKE